jgi:tetratricopeptide (TPR) repeat protein
MKTLLLPFFVIAATAYSQTQKSQPLFERANNEHAAGNYENAVLLFNEIIASNPSFMEAYAGRAASRAQLRDHAGALTDYSVVLESLPEHYNARLGRANVLYSLKRFAEAKKDYLKVLSLDPGETNTIFFQKSASAAGTMQITTAQSDFLPVILNYLGLTDYRLEDFVSAKMWLDSAIGLHPREADYYVNRGLVREKMGDGGARDDFEKALTIDPRHTAALSALGSSSNEKERGKYLDEAIESDPAVIHPLLERAYLRMQDGKFPEALEDYVRALGIEQTDPEIWLNSGFVREKLNDLEGAYSDYTKAIALREKFSKAWLNRGNVLQKQGRLDEAVEDYSVAITYDDQYAAAYYNRAVVRVKQKKNALACEDLGKAELLRMKIDTKLKEAACK